MIPKVIEGEKYIDSRGTLFFNNDFEASIIKRIYLIENKSIDVIRAWQGHKIEQRWFTAVKGSFQIKLICIDNWDNPSETLEVLIFMLDDNKQDILYIPQGYVSSIQSLEDNSKLLVMADYSFGEINDEYRFEADYFK